MAAPVHRALLVGIQEFPSIPIILHPWTRLAQDSLPGTQRSVSYFRQVIEANGCPLVAQLLNADATLANVVQAMLALARLSNRGDVVTLMFATHGVNVAGGNYLMLIDEDFTERELALLLQAFVPGVQFNVVVDGCQSGSWLTEAALAGVERPQDQAAVFGRLGRKVAGRRQPPWLRGLLADLLMAFPPKPLVRDYDIHVYGGTSDVALVNDTYNYGWMLRSMMGARGNLNLRPADLERLTEVAVRAALRAGIRGDLEDGITADEFWRLVCTCTRRRDLCTLVALGALPIFLAYEASRADHEAAVRAFLPTHRHFGAAVWRTAYAQRRAFQV